MGVLPYRLARLDVLGGPNCSVGVTVLGQGMANKASGPQGIGMETPSESHDAAEQGDAADEAGASDGASQLIPGVRRT
jgi:hypothetical protein